MIIDVGRNSCWWLQPPLWPPSFFGLWYETLDMTEFTHLETSRPISTTKKSCDDRNKLAHLNKDGLDYCAKKNPSAFNMFKMFGIQINDSTKITTLNYWNQNAETSFSWQKINYHNCWNYFQVLQVEIH